MIVMVVVVDVGVMLGSEVDPGGDGEAEVDSDGGDAEQAVGEIIIPPLAKSCH